MRNKLGRPLFYPTKPTKEHPNGIWTDDETTWSQKESKMKLTNKHHALIERHAQSMALGEVMSSLPPATTYDDLIDHFNAHNNLDELREDDDFLVYERFEDCADEELIDALEGFRNQFMRQLQEFLKAVHKMENQK